MTTTTREALKMALNTLENLDSQNHPWEQHQDVIDKCRAALAAEAKPEPADGETLYRLFVQAHSSHPRILTPWSGVPGDHKQAWERFASLVAALHAPMDAQPVKAKDCNIETFSQSDVGSYVRHLTWYVWNTHYREKSPNFELLPDTVGVLTQLDNMLTGWKAAQPVSGVVDEFEKWKASLPCDDAEHHFLEWLIHNGMDSQDDVARFAWQARAALSSNQVNAAQPENAVIHRAVEYVTRPPHGRKYPAICDVVPADEVMAFAVDLVRHIGGVK